MSISTSDYYENRNAFYEYKKEVKERNKEIKKMEYYA